MGKAGAAAPGPSLVLPSAAIVRGQNARAMGFS